MFPDKGYGEGMNVEKAACFLVGACLGTLVPAVMAGVNGLRWWGLVWGFVLGGLFDVGFLQIASLTAPGRPPPSKSSFAKSHQKLAKHATIARHARASLATMD